MAIDVTGYMNELAEAAGIPQDQRPAFLGNEKVKAVAHKALEAVEREKGRAEAEKQARQKDYEENLKIANHNKGVVEAAQAEVAKYEAKFGKLDDATRQQVVQDVIDRKTFDERIAQTEGMAIEMAKIASTLSLDYYKRFGEILDMDALQKVAVENKLNARQAYDVFIRPKVDAVAKTEFEKQLQAKYDEGLREGASKKAAAGITDAQPPNGFMTNFTRKADEAPKTTPSAAFAEAWTGWKPPTAPQ